MESHRSPESVKSEKDSEWKNYRWDGWVTTVYLNVSDCEIVYEKMGYLVTLIWLRKLLTNLNRDRGIT